MAVLKVIAAVVLTFAGLVLWLRLCLKFWEWCGFGTGFMDHTKIQTLFGDRKSDH
jgi:hypothetical protein